MPGIKVSLKEMKGKKLNLSTESNLKEVTVATLTIAKG